MNSDCNRVFHSGWWRRPRTRAHPSRQLCSLTHSLNSLRHRLNLHKTHGCKFAGACASCLATATVVVVAVVVVGGVVGAMCPDSVRRDLKHIIATSCSRCAGQMQLWGEYARTAGRLRLRQHKSIKYARTQRAALQIASQPR